MSSRNVNVVLSVDVEDWITAMRRASEQIKAFVNRPSPGIRAMRRIADRERFLADQWFQTHIDDLYAQLGLERDPHLIRGDN